MIVLIVLGEVGLADRWRSPLKSMGKLPAQLSKVLFSGRKPHFKAEDVSDEPIMSNFRCEGKFYAFSKRFLAFWSRIESSTRENAPEVEWYFLPVFD